MTSSVSRFLALFVVVGFVAGLATVVSVPRTADAACGIDRSVSVPARNAQVTCVQQALRDAGVDPGPIDGIFGSMTRAAVIQYQRARGLYVDGVVGPQTGGSLGIWGTSGLSGGSTTSGASGGAGSSSSSGSSGAGTYRVVAGDSLWGISRKTGTPLNTLLSLNGLSLGSVIHPGQTLTTSGSGSSGGSTTSSSSGSSGGSTTSGGSATTSGSSSSGAGTYWVVAGDSLWGISRKTGTPLTTLLSLNGLSLSSVIHPGQTLRTGGSGSSGGSTSSGGATSSGSSGSCAPARSVPADARVVVDVRSSGSRATVRLMTRQGDGWSCVGSAMSARVGRNGVRALASRVGGDGTTPGGVFPLGTMTAPNGDTFQFFGNGSNPGVPGAWHQVRSGDCWWADPGTPAYNTLITKSSGACTGENEYLPNYRNSYSRAALIGANMGPGRSGDAPGETPRAAAIFLHRHTYDGSGNSKSTAGCVSLAGSDLDFALTRLTPGSTYFVIT